MTWFVCVRLLEPCVTVTVLKGSLPRLFEMLATWWEEGENLTAGINEWINTWASPSSEAHGRKRETHWRRMNWVENRKGAEGKVERNKGMRWGGGERRSWRGNAARWIPEQTCHWRRLCLLCKWICIQAKYIQNENENPDKCPETRVMATCEYAT